MMQLDNKNYHSLEANKEYFSVSQFKSFLACENKAMAELEGKYRRPDTKALLMGSYVDAYFSGELTDFVEEHQDIFNTRTGELKADYKRCEQIIERINSDELFLSYISGEHQTIMTGELFGRPFKIKMDSYFPGDKIVDLKLMCDFAPMYVKGQRKTWIDGWQYDIQGFIYQSIVEYNTGKKLPFYLAAATKEEVPDIEIVEIPQWKLDSAGEIVKHYIGYFSEVKAGSVEPQKCCVCEYCKSTKVLTEPISYEELLRRTEGI